jgi:uroporphyrinogen-III synthase
MAPPLVLVTRPQPQAEAWVASLQALGISAAALPLLATAGPANPAAVRAAVLALPACALVMFVSPSAVVHWRGQWPAGWAWPAGVLAGCPGPGTAQALLAAGVPVSAIVSPPEAAGRFDSEALWQVLRPRRDWQGARVQVVRGDGGRDWLANTLRAAGAQVDLVTAYQRKPPQLSVEQRETLAQALAGPAGCCWLFSSSEAVGHLPGLTPGARWADHQALATHPRIAEAAAALGLQHVALVLPKPEAVAQALAAGLPAAAPAPRSRSSA